MRWVGFVELGLMVLAVTFLATQLLIPALRGTALFPIIHKKRQEAFETLNTAREEQEVKDILKEAEKYGVGAPVPEPKQPEPVARRRTRRA